MAKRISIEQTHLSLPQSFSSAWIYLSTSYSYYISISFSKCNPGQFPYKYCSFMCFFFSCGRNNFHWIVELWKFHSVLFPFLINWTFWVDWRNNLCSLENLSSKVEKLSCTWPLLVTPLRLPSIKYRSKKSSI